MGPKLTPLLDSLPQTLSPIERCKVSDAYLKTADKMTIKYNKKEDKNGKPTSQDSSNSEGAQKATCICRCAESRIIAHVSNHKQPQYQMSTSYYGLINSKLDIIVPGKVVLDHKYPSTKPVKNTITGTNVRQPQSTVYVLPFQHICFN